MHSALADKSSRGVAITIVSRPFEHNGYVLHHYLMTNLILLSCCSQISSAYHFLGTAARHAPLSEASGLVSCRSGCFLLSWAELMLARMAPPGGCQTKLTHKPNWCAIAINSKSRCALWTTLNDDKDDKDTAMLNPVCIKANADCCLFDCSNNNFWRLVSLFKHVNYDDECLNKTPATS